MRRNRLAAFAAALTLLTSVGGYYASSIEGFNIVANAAVSEERQAYIKKAIENASCSFTDLTCSYGLYQSAYSIIQKDAVTTTISTDVTTKEKKANIPTEEYGYYSNFDEDTQQLDPSLDTGEYGYVHVYYTFEYADASSIGTPLFHWTRHTDVVKQIGSSYSGATYFGGNAAERFYESKVKTNDHWVQEKPYTSSATEKPQIVGLVGYGEFKDFKKENVKDGVTADMKQKALSLVSAPKKEYVKQGKTLQIYTYDNPEVTLVSLVSGDYGIAVSWKKTTDTYTLQQNNEATTKPCVPTAALNNLNAKQSFFINVVKDNACWELIESEQTGYTTNEEDIGKGDYYEIYNNGEVFKHGYWTLVDASAVVGGDETASKHWFYTRDTYEHVCKGHFPSESAQETITVSTDDISGITMNIYPIEGTDHVFADSVTIYSTSLSSDAKPLAIATLSASREHREVSFNYDSRYGYIAKWRCGDLRNKGGAQDRYYLYKPETGKWELFADGNIHATSAELTKTIKIAADSFLNTMPSSVKIQSLTIYQSDGNGNKKTIKTVSANDFASGVEFEMNKMAYETYSWEADGVNETYQKGSMSNTEIKLQGKFLCDIPYVVSRDITGTVKASFYGLSENYGEETGLTPYIGLGKITTMPNETSSGSDLGKYDLTGHGACYMITNHPEGMTEKDIGKLTVDKYSASDFDNGCYFVKDYDSRYDYFLKIAKTPEEKDWVYFKWINGSWVFRVDTSKTPAVKTSLAMPMLIAEDFDIAGVSVFASDINYTNMNDNNLNFKEGRCDIASFSKRDLLNGNTEFILETNPYDGKNIIVAFEGYPETDWQNFTLGGTPYTSYNKEVVNRCFQYVGIDPVYFSDVYQYSDLDESRKAFKNQEAEMYEAWWYEPIETQSIDLSIPLYYNDSIRLIYSPKASEPIEKTESISENPDYMETNKISGMEIQPEVFFDNETISLPEGHYQVINDTTGLTDTFDIDFSGENPAAVGKDGKITGSGKNLELNIKTPVEENTCKVTDLSGNVLGESKNFSGDINVLGDVPVSFNKLKNAAPYVKYEIRSGVVNSVNPADMKIETGYLAIEEGSLVKVDDSTPIGDITLDGETGVLDIIAGQKYVMNQGKLNTTKYIKADVNKDGDVDIFDVGLIKKIVLNQ